jgi:hypothetical protein
MERLIGGEILRNHFVRDGHAATVNAAEIAAGGGFPEDQARCGIAHDSLSGVA